MRGDRQLDRARPMAVIAGGALLTSAALARRRPVPAWELDLTTAINDVPDGVASGLYPLMQLGTIGVPVAVAIGILVWRRDLALAVGAFVAGWVAWFGAKAIKRLVDRPRPLEYLPSIEVREGAGTGLGYLSGHSSVAAATAVVTAAALPRRWRPLVAALAVAVGVARIVHGVHLPADVIGGWSFGILVGLGVLEVVDHVRPLAPPTLRSRRSTS